MSVIKISAISSVVLLNFLLMDFCLSNVLSLHASLDGSDAPYFACDLLASLLHDIKQSRVFCNCFHSVAGLNLQASHSL